ncbi:MAG: hypothetical protein CFE32_22500, partial [Alphaproteobacteria bacterium PA3]
MLDEAKHANSMFEVDVAPKSLSSTGAVSRSQTSKSMKPKLNAQPNQSLIDGIKTLQALAVAEEPIG